MRVYRVPLRVVFYQEDDRWIAHCLEFDLLGDGITKQAALERLTDAIQVQLEYSIEENNPQNLFTPAESKFQQMFCAGSPVAIGKVDLHVESVEIQGIEAREFIDDGTLATC